MQLDCIFFIGPQGSGKGTQAKILAERLGFFYWEMGGILRSVASEQTELGLEVKNLIDNGLLLPDEKLIEVIKSKLNTLPNNQGLIFDGVPRRLRQAEFLLDFLKNQGKKNFVTIFLDVPKSESLNRLLKRAKKENRADDTPEKIELRLKQYYEDTLPVLDYLKTQTNFIEIQGMQNLEQVTNSINSALNL